MSLDLNPAGDKNDSPTNPLFTDTSINNDERIFTAIAADGANAFTTEVFTGTTQYSNLNTTKGFRIKCYDALTTNGILFNPAAFDTHYYFVLVYSDTDTRHHFARITEILDEDTVGDAFEFEPKLGNEIPKDTKFMIFKGHEITNNNILAFSAGILNNTSSLTLEDKLSCARPLFYFFNGLLDKNNELDHNTKYYAMQKHASISTTSHTFDTTDAITFRTVQDFGKVVIDYSRFSHRVTLTDKLRDEDVGGGGSTTKNEGGTVSLVYSSYQGAFPNARRMGDDEINSPVYTGPKRYLHYDFSPTKSNFLYNVFDHTNTESIDGKSGFAETSIIDNGRIMPRKVKEFDAYRVRHYIHRGDINEFFALAATYSSKTSNAVFSFNTEYNLNTVLNAGDEVKLGDNILIVQSFGSLTGTTQEITFQSSTHPYVRTENEGAFTAQSTTPTSGDVLYRRAYNATDGTLMLDISLINGRFSKMYVSFTSLNHNERFASVTACDAVKNIITLSFIDDSYNTNPLSFAKGEYRLHIERFNGEIENIENKKENGQTIMEIQGRDKFNKLLSPVVNLNTLFSEDIIYSSNSPYNKLSQIDSTTLSIALGDTSKTTGIADSDFDILPTVGDKIFTVNGYIGEITGVLGTSNVILNFTAALTEANSEKIYIDTEKNYVLSKALGSSHLATNKPSSLTGAANKGLIFTAGNKLTMSSGAESDSLVSSSANTSVGAIGYAIHKPSSISNDFAFQSKLKDEHGSAGESSFDTVNTLIDFEVVSTSKKDNITEIELAPYIPITLGRKVDYAFDIDDFTFSDVGNVTNLGITSSAKVWFFGTDSSTAYSLKRDDILFVGDSSSTTTTGTKTFIGKVIDIHITTNSATHSIFVYMDRNIRVFSLNEKVYLASKKSNDLVFVNGRHMWGGKINTHPHPKVSSSLGVLPLNVESINGSADNNAKYGQMYYKSKDFALGNYSNDTGIITSVFNNYKIKTFYDNPSLLNYFTSNYQFKPNISAENIINFDTTDSSYRTMPLDLRGFRNPYGGASNSTRIHRTETINLPKQGNIPLVERMFGKNDDSSERLFLYIISDLLPYSSVRKDSLMDGNKELSNYNLFLLENKTQKDNSLTESSRLSLTDSNFQTINLQSSFDISSLKRFGLMRLTEVCVDFLFNKVNPEKPINKKDTFGASSISIYSIVTLNNNGSIDTISGTTITFDDNQTIGGNTKIYDSKGYFIGQTTTGGSNTKAFTLANNAYLTNNGSAASNAVIVNITSASIYGRNNKDTFDDVSSGVHPLKVCVIPEGSTYVSTRQVSDELVLPIAFDSSDSSDIGSANSTEAISISNILENINDDQFQGIIGVSLDRFGIENGGKFPIENGATTQALYGLDTITSNSKLFLTVKAYEHFKEHENMGDTASSYITSSPYAVDGSYMVFKPRLLTPVSLTESSLNSSNGTVTKTTITSNGDGSINNFLRLLDITGCYLVPETGKSVNGFTSITTGTFTSSKSMNNVNPSTLIYVISHEVDSTNPNQHFLLTDVALAASTAYRILQPNETCIYDFFPKTLNLNVLSSSYTKQSGENKVYDTQQSYSFQHGTDTSPNNTVENEGVLSMLVIVDTDKQSSDDGLVLKDPSNFISTNLPDGQYSMYFSDGDSGKKIEITTATETDDYVSITLKDSFKGKGIISVSEPFTTSLNQELKIDPTRACIGSTVSVGLEGEDLINELLEQEGIEFTTTPTNTPMYLAPNYQGVDLYSAIRYILDRKDMKLVEENNIFKIFPEDENSLRTNIVIDDSGDFLISEFEKVSTLFDFFNEVNVYGNSHKAVRKDIRSIRKRGRKTLEVVDNTLLTQEEVDTRASKLLQIHSNLNQKLSFTMLNKGISQIRVGDVVKVYIPRENIEMSEYIVLEMKHQLTGIVKLELGRYSKDLSDVFSELLISSKETKAALRSANLQANEISYSFLDTLNTKELKLLVRKRSAGAGGRTLGFGTALGFSTPLGFTGGAITITDLVEEDLA